MNHDQIIGIIAGIFTSASLLPQLIKSVKEKDASSISIVMLLVLIAGVSLWIYYGFLKDDLPIIATNIFSDVVNITLLFFSIKYKKAKGNI